MSIFGATGEMFPAPGLWGSFGFRAPQEPPSDMLAPPELPQIPGFHGLTQMPDFAEMFQRRALASMGHPPAMSNLQTPQFPESHLPVLPALPMPPSLRPLPYTFAR